MAISEFEIKRCEKIMGAFLDAHRPPVHVRNEVDFNYRIDQQSVIIFEVRPAWNNPENMIETNVAKATYVKKSKSWKVYWQKRDLKWHAYPPCPVVKTLEEFTALVGKDEHSCFFG